MKKFLIVLLLATISFPVFAETAYNVDEATHQKYKQELLDKGYLYGFNPWNWSLIEPVRGGFNRAVMKNRVDIMELEVKAGLNVKAASPALIPYTIMHNLTAPLNFLLTHGFSANGEYGGYSYLIGGINYKKPECVKVLIDNGADVNLYNKKRYPLNYAIKKNQPTIAKMLLDAGAKPNDETYKLVEKSKNQEIKALFQ